MIVSGGYEGAFNMGKKKADHSKLVVVHDEGVNDPQDLAMNPPPGTLASHLSYNAFDHELRSTKKQT